MIWELGQELLLEPTISNVSFKQVHVSFTSDLVGSPCWAAKPLIVFPVCAHSGMHVVECPTLTTRSLRSQIRHLALPSCQPPIEIVCNCFFGFTFQSASFLVETKTKKKEEASGQLAALKSCYGCCSSGCFIRSGWLVWSHFPIFIQERVISVWEHDLLITCSEFFFAQISSTCAQICSVSAQTAWPRSNTLFLAQSPGARINPHTFAPVRWWNFCPQIFTLIFNFSCDNPVKIHRPIGGHDRRVLFSARFIDYWPPGFKFKMHFSIKM